MKSSQQHVPDEVLIGWAWEERDPRDTPEWAAHLSECTHCRIRLDRFRRVRRGLMLLAQESPRSADTIWPLVEVRLRKRTRRLLLWPIAAAAILSFWLALRGPERAPRANGPHGPEFAVLHAEVEGRSAQVYVFSPNDSLVTIWLQ